MTMRTKVIHAALRMYNSRPWTPGGARSWWRWYTRLPRPEEMGPDNNPYRVEPRHMVAPGVWR